MTTLHSARVIPLPPTLQDIVREFALKQGIHRWLARQWPARPTADLPTTPGIRIPTLVEALHDVFMATMAAYQHHEMSADMRKVLALVMEAIRTQHGLCWTTLNLAVEIISQEKVIANQATVRAAVNTAQLTLLAHLPPHLKS